MVSKEINQRVEVSGYGGFIFRGNPDEVSETNGFRWGLGAGFPSRKSLRFTAELTGEKYFKRHAHHQSAPDRRPTARSCRSASSRT